YYKQLADSYIANGDVTEAMLKETYRRYQTEVRASHILITSKSAEPADTLKAYQKALDVRKKLKAGQDFKKLAKEFSDDPSAKANGGDLNWFRAFKMIYPFEDAVYTMETGDISAPIKTDFGYHVIKKTGERASKGKISISHIMLTVDKPEDAEEVKNKIQKIYDKVTVENFGELAKQYSDDNNTAQNGGELRPIGISEVNSKRFENAAFSLEEINGISDPVETKFGWHIIKLNRVDSLASYEEMKPQIRKKVKTSSRAKLINAQISKNLQERYEAEFDMNYSDKLYQIIEKAKMGKTFKIENIKKPVTPLSTVLFEFTDMKYTYQNFLEYFEKNQLGFASKANLNERLTKTLDDYLYDKLIAHHRQELERLNPDFAGSAKTYKDGILLFEVMEHKVWDPVSEDSIAQHKYYDQHLEDFYTKENIQARVFTSPNKNDLRKFRKVYKKQGQAALAELTENFPEVMVDKTEMNKESIKIPSSLFSTKSVSRLKKHNGHYVFIDVIERQPAAQLEFNKVRGQIMNLLQKQTEEAWLKTLREKYTISVDKDVLKTLKQSFE
ncbi:MAG: peptidylprolyl isomerase, partial [Psychroflexus sp.]|nr:peptidylprolyl isomerase [Psychroflexus sp.]